MTRTACPGALLSACVCRQIVGIQEHRSANCWYYLAPQCEENGHLLELKLAAPEKGWRPGESGLTLPIPSHLRSARPDGRDVWAGAKLPQQFRTKRNRDLYDAAHEGMLQPVPGVVSTAN